MHISYYNRAGAIKSPVLDIEDDSGFKFFVQSIVLLADELRRQVGQIEQLSFREKKKLSGSQDILYRMPRDTDAISSRTDGCQEVSDVLEENNSDDSDNSDNSDDSDEEEPEEELEGIALVEPEVRVSRSLGE